MHAMEALDHYIAMARYNAWMNRRIYDVCGVLDDEQRKRDLGAFFRSIHGTLNHLLLADRTWMARFTGDADRFASYNADGTRIAFKSLADELYADFATLRREREQTDADIITWVRESLTASQLDETLRYRTSKGAALEHPTWWALSHFFNHQTHHRGQVTTLLMQLGRDPGVTDLLVLMLRPDG